MNNISIAEQYVADVLSGKIPVCDNIRLACERHERDVHRAAIGDASFPYYFDRAAAQRAIDFIQLLQPTKGEWAGKPLVLLPWQQFVVWNLFGWKCREDDTRRFRQVYIEIPRKNGKTTLLAAIGIYMLVADKEPGAEVYSAATTRDQAKEIWDEAAGMVANSKSLSKLVRRVQQGLYVRKTNSKFLPLAAEAKTLDGKNVHCALVDELHEHPDRKVYEKLKTGTGSRRQPLIIAITTAGVGQDSFCYSQRTQALQVLARSTENEALFAFVACIDDETKWEQEIEWFKSNPSLGHTKKLATMRVDFVDAKNNPDNLNDFLRYHLNIWTSVHRVWMPMGTDGWTSITCIGSTEQFPDAKKLREELYQKLKGRIGVAAADLAATIDITALVLVFPPAAARTEMVDDPEKPGKKKEIVHPADDNWYVLPYFWIPEDNIEKRVKRDGVRYDVWVREGFVEKTPGNACDSVPVTAKLKELAQDFDIREVAFDRWGAQDFVNNATGEGFLMVQFGQGYQSMSAPMKQLLKLVLKGQIVHAGNPVLRWMASNVVASTDPAGNIKPDKEKSKEKIDGIVATIMALSRAEEYKAVGEPEMFVL